MLQLRLARAAVTVGLAILAASNAVAQESPNFSIDRITVTAGGQSVNSANYETTGTHGKMSRG